MKVFRNLFVALVLWTLASFSLAAIAPGAALPNEEINLTSGTPGGTAGSITTQVSNSSFVIVLRAYANNFTTVTDTFSNTYSLQRAIQNTSDGDWLAVYLCSSCTGGSGHKPSITVSGSEMVSMGLFEITGGAASIVDVVSTGAFDTSSPFGDPVTSTNANDMILGLFGSNGAATTVTYTTGTGFTLFPSAGSTIGTNGLSLGVSYQVVSSTGTYNPAFTVSSGIRGPCITLALKASTGAAPARKNLPLLGVS